MKKYARAPLIVTCIYGGERIKLNSPYTYEKVSGWVKRRSDGGANAVALREPMGIYACEMCISKLKQGAKIDQLSLEDLGEQLSI